MTNSVEDKKGIALIVIDLWSLKPLQAGENERMNAVMTLPLRPARQNLSNTKGNSEPGFHSKENQK